MPLSLLFHIPGLATGAGAALGMSMAYMVLPSEASAMALTSQGERISFLSDILPGVSTMAHFRMVASGTLAEAGAAGMSSEPDSKTTRTKIQSLIIPILSGLYDMEGSLSSRNI
jgi:hypothetical protein